MRPERPYPEAGVPLAVPSAARHRCLGTAVTCRAVTIVGWDGWCCRYRD
ncbi:hypothetical protein DESPIG_01914 [Desulfovibrio piger ATCC 29098]|uniref:Uncharacterized protein n=1 Tax=Desulfovibrio piger ATCC 29098 TaxID=411464 RepID=B6WUZ9_9BACT|nr:hypothetical protein DESPIG_01914 [Desulfovibrio piger ATCC 29098]